jgi:hypothetical protein
MSTYIDAENNLETGTWTIAIKGNVSDVPDHIEFRFVSSAEETVFNDLSFDFELYNEEILVDSGKFPPVGVRYRQAKSTALATHRFVELKFDKNYTLKVTALDGGRLYREEFAFSVDKPEKPHESWIWSDDRWEAPIPMPLDGNRYRWSESDQNWEQWSID